VNQFNNILIVGRGTMGKGVARFLKSKNLKIEHLGAREVMKFESSDFPLNAYDLVLEFGEENLESKIALIKHLKHKLDIGLMASGTSSLSVNGMAKLVDLESKFIGIHFMNPPSIIAEVELIKSDKVSEKLLLKVFEWLTELEKKPIIVPDNPGFIINSILFTFLNSAAHLLSKTDLDHKTIDDMFINVCGHQVGPFMTLDLIGLDTSLKILQNLHKQNPQSHRLPAEVITEKVRNGELGRKTKNGFYKY